MTQRLLISDANILIDMEKGGITRQMFQLDAVFAVPEVLYEEELRDSHPNLIALGLQPRELTAYTIAYAEALIARHARTGASINDLLALPPPTGTDHTAYRRRQATHRGSRGACRCPRHALADGTTHERRNSDSRSGG